MTTPSPTVERTSGLAIAGFVCSFFFGLLGLIFSVMGYNECKRSGGTVGGAGLAIAGIVISIFWIVVFLLGIVAAVAIPAFMDSMKVSKRTEAEVQLQKIGRHAVEEYTINGTFPQATAPLTPAVDCCTQNARGRRKCAAALPDWDAPAWRALDFTVDQESYYQYSYEPLNGGAAFVARAVGDLDCDGTTVTWELRGRIVNGDPRTELIKPPPNSD
jgi:type II secretory pathway pseudopilin PulG